jgi:hypothetical protein
MKFHQHSFSGSQDGDGQTDMLKLTGAFSHLFVVKSLKMCFDNNVLEQVRTLRMINIESNTTNLRIQVLTKFDLCT